jgi:hypothetical protein
MARLQLAKFPSHPECSIGVMTLEDAKYLIIQGWLTIEGAQYLLPKNSWDLLVPWLRQDTAA